MKHNTAKCHALANLRGHIQVICGPMFAGKSEELLRLLNRLKYAQVQYLIFKPKIDKRTLQSIQSRDGRKLDAIEISDTKQIYDEVLKVKAFPLVVAFDEAQFFDQSIVEVIKILSAQKINVIVAGLDTDFNFQPFGPMPQLLAIADEVTKLKAICLSCGRDATRTYRSKSKKIDQKSTILIGDTDIYEARCINCHHNPINYQPKKLADFKKHLTYLKNHFYAAIKKEKNTKKAQKNGKSKLIKLSDNKVKKTNFKHYNYHKKYEV